MKKVNYWFIGWMTLLIVNLFVGLLDYLQKGIAWPINLTAVFTMLVLKYIEKH